MRTKLSSVFNGSINWDFDVYVLVETWLNSDFYNEEIFNANIYTIYRKDRDFIKSNCVKGGGVLIAVRKKIISSLCVLHNSDSLLDQLCVSLSGVSGNINLVVSYIPPNSSDYLYNAHVQNVLDLAVSDNKLLIFGDFNLGRVTWTFDPIESVMIPYNINSLSEMNLVDSFFSLNLVQINQFFNILNKILDLVFIDKDMKYAINECLNPLSKLDMHHKALELHVEFYVFSKIAHDSFRLDFKKCDFNLFNKLISDIDWNNLFVKNNLSDCYEVFLNVMNKLCEENLTLLKPRIYKLPWYTNGLKRIKNKRNKYFKRWKVSNDPQDKYWHEYFSREFNFLNKFLYKQYLLNFETNIKSNPKSFWNFINSKRSSSDFPTRMVYNGKIANSQVEIANLFADFFSSNFINNNASNYSREVLDDTHINFGSLQISETDLQQGFAKLKITFRVDCDGFCSFFLKGCSTALLTPLMYLFNRSLMEGNFINKWKVTSISPVYKSGAKDNISNYRPISKLSNIAKLFEHIIFEKVYFAVKSIISPFQHGFVRGRSTVTNLVSFSQYCISNFELGFQIDAIYTDLSKAFDKVSHPLLINKLFALGFHSSFLNWIASYLSERRCVVVVESCSSNAYTATSGIPQGSIIGPLLFILFVNDVPSLLKYSRMLLFADDWKIYSRVNSFMDTLRLQSDLDAVSLWCSENGLPINVSKCCKVSFSKSNNIICSDYFVNSCTVKCSIEVFDLGVFFDYKFSFISHLDYIVPKAYALLAFIKRSCKDFNDPYTVKLVYSSIVRSRLEYACIIWNPYMIKYSNRIEQIQRRFLKFALRSINFSIPEPSYLDKCRLIALKSLENRRMLQSQMFLYKIINGLVDCSDLLNLLSLNVPPRLLRHNKFFHIPLHRTNYSINEPITRALKEFNRINEYNLDIMINIEKFADLLDLIYF
ncbi:uncharacterized protein LOC142239568 [Haematobia irritans]|uniref:uncharacterized protein LOC142239568 n=1 Tax=Haematobia irritans TaxID=7368 RepID=UPI003F4F95C1